jgi:hypothetical protein
MITAVQFVIMLVCNINEQRERQNLGAGLAFMA